MQLGQDGYDRSAGASGTLGPPSGKAILLKLAPERLVHPTHPDAPDAHFVVADDYCFFVTIDVVMHRITPFLCLYCTYASCRYDRFGKLIPFRFTMIQCGLRLGINTFHKHTCIDEHIMNLRRRCRTLFSCIGDE